MPEEAEGRQRLRTILAPSVPLIEWKEIRRAGTEKGGREPVLARRAAAILERPPREVASLGTGELAELEALLARVVQGRAAPQ